MSLHDVLNASRELLDRREAAMYLNVKPQTLTNWACTRRYDLPFVKIGSLVRYKKSDLDAFIARRTRGGEE